MVARTESQVLRVVSRYALTSQRCPTVVAFVQSGVTEYIAGTDKWKKRTNEQEIRNVLDLFLFTHEEKYMLLERHRGLNGHSFIVLPSHHGSVQLAHV